MTYGSRWVLVTRGWTAGILSGRDRPRPFGGTCPEDDMSDARKAMTGKSAGKLEAARMQLAEATPVTPEQLHCGLRVIMEFVAEEGEKEPTLEHPKVSLALLNEGSWVCSVVWWPKRLQVACFSFDAGRAMYKLAERLCEGGDIWRPMKEK